MNANFRKTARQIALAPWNLIRASNYLVELCDSNESKRTFEAPQLVSFVESAEALRLRENMRQAAGPPEELLTFAPGTPKRVVVNLEPKAKPRAKSKEKGRGRGGRGRGRARGGQPEESEEGTGVPPQVAVAPAAPHLPAGAPDLAEDVPGLPVPAGPRPDPPDVPPPPAPVVPRAPRRGLKRPAAAPDAAVAAAAAKPAAAPQNRYRQDTIDKQDKLGCNKCKYSARGCGRCKEIHALYKAQRGIE